MPPTKVKWSDTWAYGEPLHSNKYSPVQHDGTLWWYRHLTGLITKGPKTYEYLREEFIPGMMTQFTLAPKEGHRGGCSHCAAPESRISQCLPGWQESIKPRDCGLGRLFNQGMNFKHLLAHLITCLPNKWAFCNYHEKPDIWSLGCLAYRLYVLVPPITAFNQKEVYRKICVEIQMNPCGSDGMKDITMEMFNGKGCHRPLAEDILESRLIPPLTVKSTKKKSWEGDS